MAELQQTPWRAAWVRAVARKVKAWAESVLAEEAQTASATGAPRPESVATKAPVATPPLGPLSPGATLEDLEARWLRDLEARRRVPMGDWVARSSKGAPRVPEDLAREGLVPPRGPGVAAGMPRRPTPRVPSVTEAPRSVVQYLSPSEAEPRGAESDLRPEPPFPFDTARAPRPMPSPIASRWSAMPAPRSEPEPMRSTPPSSWGLGPENFAAFRVPPTRTPVSAESRLPLAPVPREVPSAEPGAPSRRSPWDDLPPFASEARDTRTPTRVPPLSMPLSEEAPPAFTEHVKSSPALDLPRVPAPWQQRDEGPGPRSEPRELPRSRVSYLPDEGPWDDARAPLTWRPRLVEAPLPTPPDAHDEPASSTGSPWPELPPAPVPESTETVVELRQWERRRRLDREQRGE
ncbi:hypothetical protein JY651_49570 [Pyxidicoccus parkwayensis]|uniref:Uncharacterized protein n=1 Tax=Pyxidicoccus parkwayensis TaxID=2813578 RepID=A0ABX7NW02_9BACT|nr:hypothetical protein [Pyxidicoccus parkwaysis]QSQ23054.1 hypothetical protein JY651_49570 [Pyxidicoccus parkwaysis]